MLPDNHTVTPWYRQFWPWMLIALPLSVVIASMITIFLATDHPDSVVVDDYYKQGLAINRDIAREQHAAEMGIALQLQLFADPGQLHVVYSSTKGEPPQQLKIQFIHPTLKERDQTVILARTGDRVYSGMIGKLDGDQWDLVVEPEDGQWRISTRIKSNSTGTLHITSQ